jgi:type IV pilus assembly protein PilM
MAANNRIYSLNLGSQTVRFAEFRSDGRGGLVLRAYRTAELLADPAADATHIGQAALAVREVVSAIKAGGKSVNYAIPAQSVFTRFVKLPSVGEEKVDQIVQFEAQQNVPFPIEEVVWDYQLVASSEAEKFEVVLVAIKSDILEELNGAVEGAGVRAGVVDVAPMALYNAFRYNYSDLGGSSLVVDIGARTTNLLFVESKKVFSRSIPIGGNTITAAIAKDFDEPFAAAEERKKRQGLVSMGGAYAEPTDHEVARVSKMVRNTMTRLHSEISRSISFYRSQQGGSQPERVFLCGGGVAMPYTREFFSEKLALPIEFFNPLRNVAIASGVDAETVGRDAHLLGELVGLGLRSVSECPMELNLRPPSVVRKQEMAARVPYLLMAGACLLLTMGGWWLFYVSASTATAKVLKPLKEKVAGLQSFEDKFTRIRSEIKTKQDTIAPLVRTVEDRDYWLNLIDDLNKCLPESSIWISSMEVMAAKDLASAAGDSSEKAPSGPELIIKGFYLSNSDRATVVDTFAANLAKSSFYKIDPSQEGLKSITKTRESQSESAWTFRYELHLPLKKAIEL